ncbi:MAG: YbaB/EbfC family nucleoid-associated protein [Candidatus Nealsonbacteria bacterium]|nr:YbaB/EbfC family nucleoid-associated protein [Candidatus Nealsonbacteria bacterium]
MFEKIKQLKQLKDLKDSLEKEKFEIEKNGTKITMNGKMEIEEIKLNPALAKEEQEIILKDCFNEAMKKIQMIAAQKMMQMQD